MLSLRFIINLNKMAFNAFVTANSLYSNSSTGAFIEQAVPCPIKQKIRVERKAVVVQAEEE